MWRRTRRRAAVDLPSRSSAFGRQKASSHSRHPTFSQHTEISRRWFRVQQHFTVYTMYEGTWCLEWETLGSKTRSRPGDLFLILCWKGEPFFFWWGCTNLCDDLIMVMHLQRGIRQKVQKLAGGGALSVFKNLSLLIYDQCTVTGLHRFSEQLVSSVCRHPRSNPLQ